MGFWGFGAKYFSQQLDAERVMAMFNIEMIGTESKWGRSSAYITGFEKSNMGKILQDNLADSKFKFPVPFEHMKKIRIASAGTASFQILKYFSFFIICKTIPSVYYMFNSY